MQILIDGEVFSYLIEIVRFLHKYTLPIQAG